MRLRDSLGYVAEVTAAIGAEQTGALMKSWRTHPAVIVLRDTLYKDEYTFFRDYN